MSRFDQIIDRECPQSRNCGFVTDLMIETLHYNRRRFILARRSLALSQRTVYDELVAASLSLSISGVIGQPSLTMSDLATLIEKGWARSTV